MIYEYQCPVCNASLCQDRMVKDRNLRVDCPKCDIMMNRIISAPYVHVKGYGQYNPGLGIVEKNKDSKKDHIKKHYDTTGDRLVEIGNDNQKSVKRKRKSYAL